MFILFVTKIIVLLLAYFGHSFAVLPFHVLVRRAAALSIRLAASSRALLLITTNLCGSLQLIWYLAGAAIAVSEEKNYARLLIGFVLYKANIP